MPGFAKSGKRFPTHIVVFMAPAVIVYTLFMIYPLLDSLRVSFYTPDDTGALSFVGLGNYETLFFDENWSKGFWNALSNNFILFAIHMLVQNPIGLLLAALLSLPTVRGRNIYRTAMFLPTMMSVVIIGFVWQLILNPLWGVAETLLDIIGMVDYFQPWLGQESTALVTISLISVWQFVGIPMMLIYAALLNIPEELTEAAIIDGANHWQQFRHITLPMLRNTLVFVTVMTIIGSFQVFTSVYIMTSGGPERSTEVIAYSIFINAFAVAGQMGYASALAWLLFAVIFVFVFFQMRVFRSRRIYDE